MRWILLSLVGIVLVSSLLGSSLNAAKLEAAIDEKLQNEENSPAHMEDHDTSDYIETIKKVAYLSRRYEHQAILIAKDERRAYLFKDGKVDTSFRIALGPNPQGDKLYEGDGRTPEGLYVINWRRDGTPGNTSYFGLAFLLDYPRTHDVEEFKEAQEQGLIPPGVDSPGGHIEIHAGPDSYDWTLGCISMNRKGVKYLMDSGVTSGTKVGIVGYIPEDVDLNEVVTGL